ncbi:nuclear transport factor 2 family protein [Mycobacterium sp. C31M]
MREESDKTSISADTPEIANLLTRYCRAVDSGKWALYRSLFTDDAHVDYSAAGLVVGSVDEAVAYLGRTSISVGMHYVTNIEATVDGDTADVIAMWFNAVGLPGKDSTSFFGGRWHDTLVRADEGWRIQNLQLEVVW